MAYVFFPNKLKTLLKRISEKQVGFQLIAGRHDASSACIFCSKQYKNKGFEHVGATSELTFQFLAPDLPISQI